MLTPEERRDAEYLAGLESPTMWQIRQIIRYFIADTNGVYIRVTPEPGENDKLVKAFLKANDYFRMEKTTWLEKWNIKIVNS